MNRYGFGELNNLRRIAIMNMKSLALHFKSVYLDFFNIQKHL